jgi:hypothetical protein
MRSPRRCLRQFAGKLMLVAMLAFVGQSAMIIVSNAAASAGLMPQPATTLSGPVHVHDGLAGHVHSHGGDNKAGHVHQGLAHDDDDDDDAGNGGKALIWTIACSAAVVPMAEIVGIPFDLAGGVGISPRNERDGVEPDTLLRPPSTPGIA